MKRVVLFDADVLAYRASAAAEERKVQVTHIPSNKMKVFKNKTEFKDLLKEKNREFVPEEYEIVDLQIPKPEYILNPIKIIDAQIKNIVESLWADEYRVLISGKGNFRDNLPLPYKYKGNREDMLRPLALKSCRNFLIKEYNAEVINGHETDDALIYRGYEFLNKSYETIIVTNDKDAYSYSGISVYDYTKDEPAIEEIPELGELREEKKIKGNGILWYCTQMLIGDSTDNYKPTDVAGIKFGEKSAYRLLKDCKTPKDALEVVVQKYKEWYPRETAYLAWDGSEIKADWKYMLSLYHYCVRMMSTPDDKLIAKDFYARHGVHFDG